MCFGEDAEGAGGVSGELAGSSSGPFGSPDPYSKPDFLVFLVSNRCSIPIAGVSRKALRPNPCYSYPMQRSQECAKMHLLTTLLYGKNVRT